MLWFCLELKRRQTCLVERLSYSLSITSYVMLSSILPLQSSWDSPIQAVLCSSAPLSYIFQSLTTEWGCLIYSFLLPFKAQFDPSLWLHMTSTAFPEIATGAAGDSGPSVWFSSSQQSRQSVCRRLWKVASHSVGCRSVSQSAGGATEEKSTDHSAARQTVRFVTTEQRGEEAISHQRPTSRGGSEE